MNGLVFAVFFLIVPLVICLAATFGERGDDDGR